MKNFLYFLLLAVVLLTGFSFTQDDVQSRIEKVENNLLPSILLENGPRWNIYERMEFYNLQGVSIAVIRDFEIDWVKGYGYTDVETKEPVTENTMFQAASISKPVAALAALKKVQEGKLSIFENVNNKLKSWKLPDNKFTEKNKVTLGHLLSHSGGVTVHGFRGYGQGENAPDLVQVLNGEKPANSAPIRVNMEPGLRFRYSGGGYTIMQQMLVDIEGKTFPEIMKKTVLEPLGMLHSTYEQPLPPEKLRYAAAGHRPGGVLVTGKRHTYPEMAAAGLWTTPGDLARFTIEIQLSMDGKSNKILSKELTKMMLTPFVSEIYGLGLSIEKRGNAIYFGHGGSNEGFKCQILAHKEKGYGVVVMTNSDDGYKMYPEIIRSVAKVYGWDDYLPDELKVISLAPDIINRFRGRYRINDDDILTVSRENDKLMFENTRNERYFALPVSENEFVAAEKGIRYTFEADTDGTIDRVIFVESARRFRAVKITDSYIAPMEYVFDGKMEEAADAYRKLKEKTPRHWMVTEERFNSLGYELLGVKRYQEAIAVFKLNVELYPKSANTYDSLAEAYLISGNRERAMTYYKKVLEIILLDPREDKEYLENLRDRVNQKLKKLK